MSPVVFVFSKLPRFNRGLPFNLQVTDEWWKIIVPKIVVIMMEVVLNRFPQQEAQTAHSIIENNNLASPLIYHFRQGSRGVNLSTNLFAVNI